MGLKEGEGWQEKARRRRKEGRKVAEISGERKMKLEVETER
jgi:hypothetical protein